jgi:hypothetical protein
MIIIHSPLMKHHKTIEENELSTNKSHQPVRVIYGNLISHNMLERRLHVLNEAVIKSIYGHPCICDHSYTHKQQRWNSNL